MNARWREAHLKDKAYSAKEEKGFLALMGQGLLTDFPNPSRAGCPGPEIISAIASQTIPLVQAEPYLDHLTSCSPCYRDFSQNREAYQARRKRTISVVAASVLLVFSIGSWAAIRRLDTIRAVQDTVVDLRNVSVTEKPEVLSAGALLECSRKTRRLDIYLPLGSPEGVYEIRIAAVDGKAIFTGQTTTNILQGIESLLLNVRLSSAQPGLYTLRLRNRDSDWNSFPMWIE